MAEKPETPENKPAGKAAEHADSFTERRFWKKLQRFAGKIGCPLLCKALSMYYSFRDHETPLWAKTTIMGALGYLISLVDVIPDLVPALGYTDDLAVIVAAMGAVALYIKDEHRQKAQQQVERLLGSCKCADEGG